MKTALAAKLELEVHKHIEGARIGRIVNIDDSGKISIDYNGNMYGPIAARFTNEVKAKIASQKALPGQEVLIVFENADPQLPVIVDTIHCSVEDALAPADMHVEMEKIEDVVIDGRKMTFDAREQIVLRCGKASITLTKAGKIMIRGAYISNRSSGVNRIKGGSVQIN